MPTYVTQLTPFGTAKVKLSISHQLKGEKGEPGLGIFDITYDFLSDYIAVRNGEPIPLQLPPDIQAPIANYAQYMQWQHQQHLLQQKIKHLQRQQQQMRMALFKFLRPKVEPQMTTDDDPLDGENTDPEELPPPPSEIDVNIPDEEDDEAEEEEPFEEF